MFSLDNSCKYEFRFSLLIYTDRRKNVQMNLRLDSEKEGVGVCSDEVKGMGLSGFITHLYVKFLIII